MTVGLRLCYTSLPMKLATACCVVALLGTAACGRKATATPPFYSTDGSWIRDRQGRVVLLRGMNLSEGDKRPDPTTGKFFPAWLGPEDFQTMASWGLNSIRFVIVWEALEPQRGAVDAHYLDDLVQRIEWARQAGLLVIVDLHQDIYARKYGGDGAPDWAILDDGIPYTFAEPWPVNALSPAVERAFDSFWTNRDGIQDALDQTWTKLAEVLADDDTVVGYDLMNEPYFGSDANLRDFDQTRLGPYYDRAFRAILSADPHHVGFMEPCAFRSNVMGIGGFPSSLSIAGDLVRRAVYAPHYYDPTTVVNASYDGNTGRLTTLLQAEQDDATRLGVPTWVGEWGLTDAYLPGATLYVADQLKVLDHQLVGWAYWDYDRGPNNWVSAATTPALSSLLTRPEPSQVMGTPKSLSFDPRTGSFELVYRESPGSAPTEIRVPTAYTGETVAVVPPRAFRWVDGAVPGVKILEIDSTGSGADIQVTLH